MKNMPGPFAPPVEKFKYNKFIGEPLLAPQKSGEKINENQ
jgi:hypothetical protein